MTRAIFLMVVVLGTVIAAQTSVQSPVPPTSGPTTTTIIPAKTPDPLNETQRLFLQNKMQAMEIAQLRFEAAKADLLAFLKTVEREGFDLDLQTGKYVPKPKTDPKKE